jgi:hypothetical protein
VGHRQLLNLVVAEVEVAVQHQHLVEAEEVAVDLVLEELQLWHQKADQHHQVLKCHKHLRK